MAITVYGVPDSIDAAHWSQLMQDLGDAGTGAAVVTGLTTTIAGSTVQVSTGRSLQAGTSAVVDASATVAVTANVTGNPRLDTLCLQVDWTGTTSTAGSLVVVQGSPAASPVGATLTQTPGVLWQTPLARFRVAAGASAPSSLVDARVLSRGGAVRKGYTTTAVNGSGDLVITHNLGVLPSWFTAESTNWNVECTPNWTSRTATTFTVGLRRRTDWQQLITGSYSIVWKAEA